MKFNSTINISLADIMQNKISPYQDLEKKSWDEVEHLNQRTWRAPYSVHVPIHPPHAETFVYMDGALNAYTLPMLPNVQTGMEGLQALLNGIETMIAQFAFDQPAFIPDFRLSKLELTENRFPVVRASYFAWDTNYEIEYFTTRIGKRQNALWINVSASNESDVTQEAHVRVKVNFQKERELFDYHYVPFYWDATKWRDDDSVRLNGKMLVRNGKPFGLLENNAFDMEHEVRIRFEDMDYNKKFDCSRPYFVQPCMRLKSAGNLLHFHKSLDPGTRATFTLALLTEQRHFGDQSCALLKNAGCKQARDRTLHELRSICDSPQRAKLRLPQDNMQAVFDALQIANQQMLIDFHDDGGLQPCQGGSSERFYVWVWEAMCMLRPMLSIGHFAEVRKVIGFIFSLQDGGCPPDGAFTSLQGAIGTTGPRWINATGSALALAADYYNYSREDDFLEEYLPKMLAAAHWIIGEIKATRKLNADGSRPPTYGLMPFGRGTDGDKGHVVSFSDAFSYFGLAKLLILLKTIDHPDHETLAAEVRQYHGDINQAVDHLQGENGFIDRKIVNTPGKDRIARKFNNVCGSQMLCYVNALSADDRRFRKHIEYCENQTRTGFFVGAMDRDINYIGTSEHVWQNIYLRRGDWKKAYTLLQTNLKYGLSKDALLVQERFSITDPAYTPWQPNASGNGRMLEMICNQFYFEHDDRERGLVTTFLGGIPPSWYAFHPQMALTGLHTVHGIINVEIQRYCVTISCQGFTLKNRVLRFPDYLDMQFDTKLVDVLGEGYFNIKSKKAYIKGTIGIMNTASRDHRK